ncbi:hypothetical protein FMM05_20235 [Flavobacterium zepuense]|uniref:Uncharacterized protein n=1 Tax=Flavobacterium zepuense TaxID=2593302 RepID=A0A552UTC3_9FLAO|nr:hypothetical protein [Flavobacterium zepuense]TRW21481.1 hypothetical protein FMM05_20235 [Flavobacterium zepuense]
MKTKTKFAVSLMVGVMAIIFSAFTSGPENEMTVNRNAKGEIVSVTNTYFRIATFASTATDTNPSHYVFSNTNDANCVSNNNICKSRWTTTSNPTNGQTPSDAGSPSFSSNLSDLGTYNGQ